jgi:hypothetical protein
MTSFKVGDHIRVSRIAGSIWQDRDGTIVDVIVRYDNGPVQECAVAIGLERRWFLGRHLLRTVPPPLVRYFRSEVLDRWKLEPDVAAALNGDQNQLIDYLCQHCDLPIRRAQVEVDALYDQLDRMVETAGEVVELTAAAA